MEDGFGNIIYVIITLVALVITVLARKKKKLQQAPGTETREITRTDPFDLFGPDEITDEPIEKELLLEEVEEKPILTNVLNMKIEEGISDLKDRPSLTELEAEGLKKAMLTDDPEHQPTEELVDPYLEDTEGNDLNKILKEFDLKNAVILSEILNRKEF